MKYTATLATALSVLALIPPAQAEEMSKNYFSVSGGMINVRDADFKYDDGVDQLNGDVELDRGLHATAALGRRLTDHVRGEIELGYNKSDLDKLSAHGLGEFDSGGDLKTLTGLVNGYYDLMPENKVSPFVTAGVGVARHKAELTSIAGIVLDDIDGSDTVLAYQLGAGANMDVSEKTTLVVGYRYQASRDAEFDDTKIDYAAHVVRAGVKFDF